MDFEILPALLAGWAAGAAMTAAMIVMRRSGQTEMDMVLMQGAMFTDDQRRARVLGAVLHLVLMAGLVFGTVYAGLFTLLTVASDNAWWVGALLGVGHGLLAGMVMVLMPRMHPRMERGPAAEPTAGALLLKSPGLFARNYGAATPVGLVLAHALYGSVIGIVYASLT